MDRVVRRIFPTEETSKLKGKIMPDLRRSGRNVCSAEGRACAKTLRSLLTI